MRRLLFAVLGLAIWGYGCFAAGGCGQRRRRARACRGRSTARVDAPDWTFFSWFVMSVDDLPHRTLRDHSPSPRQLT